MAQRTIRSGFTIVELLVVVVVIGILASISLVAYNGIQNRANDAARMAEASEVNKKIQIKQLNTGTVTPGSPAPASRDEYMSRYDMSSLSRVVYIDGHDTTQPDFYTFNKKKIYVRDRSNYVSYSYWSYARNEWVISTLYDDGTAEESTGTRPSISI